MIDQNRRPNPGTAREALARLYPEGVCMNCHGMLGDAEGPHLCAVCEKRALEAKRQDDAASEARERAVFLAKIKVIPPRYRDARLTPELAKRVANPECIARATEMLGKPMVTLTGGAGSGKTSLAAAMVATSAEHAADGKAEARALVRDAMWVTAASLSRARSEHSLGVGEAPLVDAAMSASLLVIDDAGMEREFGTVTDVIFRRHDEMLPTIVTTGFGRTALTEKYGDGVVRRMVGDHVAVPIRCDRPKV